MVTETANSAALIDIIDDSAENRHLLAGMLLHFGFRVRMARNGRLALEQIALAPPDLILLDIDMPGMNGFEVCERLKASAETRDIPVLFISALQETEDKLTAFGAGGVDYVTKPFHLEEVLARVNAHLKLHRQQESLHAMVDAGAEQLQQTHARLQQNIEATGNMLEQTLNALLGEGGLESSGVRKQMVRLAVAIAEECALPADHLEALRVAAVLHSAAQQLSIELMSNAGARDAESEVLLSRHCMEIEAKMRGFDYPWPVAAIIRRHHDLIHPVSTDEMESDRLNRIAGNALAAAELIAALSNSQPYAPPTGLDSPLHRVKRGEGTLFMPEVVAATARLFEQKGFRLHRPTARP